MLLESSINPKRKMAVPPERIEAFNDVSIGKNVSDDENATKNASPPDLAVGVV